MNARLSKIIAIVLSVIVIITALVTAVSFATSTTVTKKLTSKDHFEEAYHNGSYTKNITIDEVDFGVMEIVNLVTDFRYVLLVTRTQGHEQIIRDYEESIKKIKEQYDEYRYEYTGDKESDSYKNRCQEYEDRIKDVEKSIEEEDKEFNEWRDANYTSEDFETLKEMLLTDDDFLNSIGTMYYLFSLGSDDELSLGREAYLGSYVIDEEKYDLSEAEIAEILSESAAEFKYSGIAYVIIIIFGGIFVALLILMIIISIFTLLISSIKSIVKLIKSAKNSDNPVTVFGKNEFTATAISALVFALLAKIINGAGIQIGSWINLAVILVIVNSVCSMIVNLIAEKINAAALIKTALTAVSTVLAAIILTTVVNSGMVSTATNKIASYDEDMFKSRYVEQYTDLLKEHEAELEGYLEEGNTDDYESKLSSLRYEAKEKAMEFVTSNDIRLIIIVCANAVLVLAALGVFGNIICRLSGAVYSAKGDNVEYKYGETFVAPVFAIAACVALCFFTISSASEVEESVLNSKYSVFIGEYQVEETADYLIREDLEEDIENGEVALDVLREEAESIDDEDSKKVAVSVLKNTERQLNIKKNDLALVENNNFPLVKTIVLLAVVLALEIVHKVLSKILGKKDNDSSKTAPAKEAPIVVAPKEEPAVVTNEEPEAVAEEAQAEEAPAEA